MNQGVIVIEKYELFTDLSPKWTRSDVRITLCLLYVIHDPHFLQKRTNRYKNFVS